eukprot:2955149-Heterocapsa_arctica.AAC.1
MGIVVRGAPRVSCIEEGVDSGEPALTHNVPQSRSIVVLLLGHHAPNTISSWGSDLAIGIDEQGYE